MNGYVGYPTATGAVETRAAIVSCPTCTYLTGGDCVVCEAPSDHPACDGCRDGAVVWYRKPVVVNIAAAVVVSIIAGVVVARMKRHVDWFN